MSNPEVFSRNGSKFPVYIQGDAFPAVYNSLKELVHGCGGVVLDAPDRALAICITNRDTPLGANLIAKYYQSDTTQHRRGVVDYHWVNACVDKQALLGPPNWGGYYLSPLTLDDFFNNSPPTSLQSLSLPLSQTPTLVSPPSVSQALPTPGEKSMPPSKRPSLPKVPSQILQRFQQSAGPSTSSTAFPTPSTEDRLSRQLSAPAEDPHADERDPAPTPPPESQKTLFTGGSSIKYRYTDAENWFIRDYAKWAKRQGIPASDVPTRIFRLMNWHSVASIASHLTRQPQANKGWAYVPADSIPSPYVSKPSSSSNRPRQSLGRRKSLNDNGSSSLHGRRRTRNASVGGSPVILPDRLMMWSHHEAPPEAPRPGSPVDPEFGHPFTPEDKVYVVEFARWAGGRMPQIDLDLLSAALARYAEHHSQAKWYAHMSKYSSQYANRVPAELAHIFIDHQNTDDEEDFPLENEQADEREDVFEFDSEDVVESDEEDRYAVNYNVKNNQEKRGGKRSGLAYTDEELGEMGKLVLQNPGRAYYTLFEEFAASRAAAGLHPQRTGAAYAQYYRAHSEKVKQKGRVLLNLPASNDRPEEEAWYDVDEPADTGDSTPSNKKGSGPLYTQEEITAIARVVNDGSKKPLKTRLTKLGVSRNSQGLLPRRNPSSYFNYYRKHVDQIRGLAQQLAAQSDSPSRPNQLKEKNPMRRVSEAGHSSSNMDEYDRPANSEGDRNGLPYDEEDFAAMVEFVSRHPGLIRDSEEALGVTRQSLFSKFDRERPGRSAKTWAEFFRRNADRIEKEALELIAAEADEENAEEEEEEEENIYSSKLEAEIFGGWVDMEEEEEEDIYSSQLEADIFGGRVGVKRIKIKKLSSESPSKPVESTAESQAGPSRAAPKPEPKASSTVKPAAMSLTVPTSGHSPKTKRSLSADAAASAAEPATKKFKEHSVG